jgi:hypothetical protein
MSIRKPDGTIIHMPFPGHRTIAEVDEQQVRDQIRRSLGEKRRRA